MLLKWCFVHLQRLHSPFWILLCCIGTVQLQLAIHYLLVHVFRLGTALRVCLLMWYHPLLKILKPTLCRRCPQIIVDATHSSLLLTPLILETIGFFDERALTSHISHLSQHFRSHLLYIVRLYLVFIGAFVVIISLCDKGLELLREWHPASQRRQFWSSLTELLTAQAMPLRCRE